MSATRVVLAEYFCTDDRTLLFLVREDFKEPVVAEVMVPLPTLRAFVAQHLGAAHGTRGEITKTVSRKVSNLDETAFQTFLEPFLTPLTAQAPDGQPIVQENDLVWFVPHDALHYLPLHAVKLEGRYLIERNPVCYSPSASVMTYCHARRKGRRERLLALADSRADRPLLQARLEVAGLEEIFRPHAEVHCGDQATKSLLKRRLAEDADNVDILHLACHGTFRTEQPLRSGVELAQEGGQPPAPPAADGAEWDLTAEEIFDLRLKADLVTLSACESGFNDRRPGDELIGLTRALIYAGTPSVLVSLWSVDDVSTAMLMSRFYRGLRDGASKAEALRRAQTELRADRVRDVLDFCTAAQGRLAAPDAATRRLLAEYVAEAQIRAGDWRAAADTYAQLLSQRSRDDPDYAVLRDKQEECQLTARGQRAEGNYDAPAFDRIFFWAPFVLVGDWK
jgi:CHAT domain-containing protein